MHSKTNQRLMPWGCDQQGRYATRERGPRHEHWAAAEHTETMIVPQHSYAASPILEPRGASPWSLGNLSIAAAIVAVVAYIITRGPWL